MRWKIGEAQTQALLIWGYTLMAFGYMTQTANPLERHSCSKAYGIVRNTEKYETAHRHCSSVGMKLAAPKTSEEIAALKDYFAASSDSPEIAYLGSRDVSGMNMYRFEDGRPLKSVKGAEMDLLPINNSRECLVTDHKKRMFNFFCEDFPVDTGYTRSAMCEVCIEHRPGTSKTGVLCACSNRTVRNYTENTCNTSCLEVKRFDHLIGTFPCKPQRYGPDCIFQCYCKDDTPCDINTGACPDGCQNNWHGMACNVTKCPLNRWGRNCDQLCFCQNEQHCHFITGYCMVGCMPGLLGKSCLLSKCADGKYGPGCNRSCHCKESVPCSSSGICVSDKGCSKNSWIPPRCVATKCPTGSYGSKCQYSCNCVDNEQCDSDGDCSSGCGHRWIGPKCDKTWCPVGYYGEHCKLVCDCDPGLPCSRIAGVCLGANVIRDEVCEKRGKSGPDCASNCEDPNCRTCEKYNPGTCHLCNFGYNLTSPGACNLDQTYCNQPRKTGVRCGQSCTDEHCLRCDRHNEDICFSCQFGYDLTTNMTCVELSGVCDQPGQAGPNCEQKCMDKACVHCRKYDKDVCQTCMFGFMVSSDMKCEEDTNACEEASKWGPDCTRLCSDHNCLSCWRTDGDICTQCKSGYVIDFFYMCYEPKVYDSKRPRKSWIPGLVGLFAAVIIPAVFYASIHDIYQGLEPADANSKDEEERSEGFSLSRDTYISDEMLS